jgi:endonuclease I
MQADMFNLYTAIGAVNALRSNYNFTMRVWEVSDFDSCKMKIENRKAEPQKGWTPIPYILLNHHVKINITLSSIKP